LWTSFVTDCSIPLPIDLNRPRSVSSLHGKVIRRLSELGRVDESTAARLVLLQLRQTSSASTSSLRHAINRSNEKQSDALAEGVLLDGSIVLVVSFTQRK